MCQDLAACKQRTTQVFNKATEMGTLAFMLLKCEKESKTEGGWEGGRWRLVEGIVLMPQDGQVDLEHKLRGHGMRNFRSKPFG